MSANSTADIHTPDSSADGVWDFYGTHNVIGHLSGPTITAIVLALIALTGLVVLCRRRPKFTIFVVGIWLVWLAAKFLQGEAAWNTVKTHAHNALEASVAFARAVWTLVVAWVVFVLPLLGDVWHFLEPLLEKAGEGVNNGWNATTWEERCIAILCFVGIIGSTRAVVLLWQRRDTLRDVLFQLSFVVVGPLVWKGVSMLDHRWSRNLVVLAIDIWPVIVSLRLLVRLEDEKAKQQKEAENAGWFRNALSLAAPEKFKSRKDFSATELHLGIRHLLAYWSCWPLLHLLFLYVVESGCVPEKDKSAGDGVIIALIIWFRFWRVSLIAPYFYGVLHGCVGRFADAAGRVASNATSRGAGAAFKGFQWARSTAASASGPDAPAVGTKRRLLVIAGLVLAILGLISLLLNVLAFVSAVATIAILLGAAGDSARWVARDDADMCASRLSFWVIALAFLWLCQVPLLGGFLELWTPLVFAASLAGGEQFLLKLILKVVVCVHARLPCVGSGSDAKKTTGSSASNAAEPLLANATDAADSNPATPVKGAPALDAASSAARDAAAAAEGEAEPRTSSAKDEETGTG
eukprot:TRINITY_DN64169_c0_g1_i1.p1 TRINITY_DN64169_c0_g1~~TRINITY_DN64169_c0_g1_i1.p1  ORF type:complete len:578 (-),score=112.12 TRINITY_DN64169_c0_g1_i1:93-1826(-)